MVLHQYDYIFAIGTIFAFLDAYNIGANDVANSWATSVASRSLTLFQAMVGAAIMEFAGAFGVGARVADTIKTKIVSPDQYESEPAVLMLGMTCAIVGSSLWLTFCTKIGLPVSTTHSLMGGVIGMGLASVGAEGITWVAPAGTTGTEVVNTGVASVFAAWLIAPGISACFGAILFTITKYGVMLRKDPVMKAFIMVPIYFSITAMLLIMLLLWKGGAYEVRLTDQQIPGVIVGSGIGFGLLVSFFFLPWLYRVVVKDDWELKWHHIFQGPFLLRRGEVPPPPADFTGAIRNFYEGHLTREELDAKRAAMPASTDVEANTNTSSEAKVLDAVLASDSSETNSHSGAAPVKTHSSYKSIIGPRPEGLPWTSKEMLWWGFKLVIFHGVDKDIASIQSQKKDKLSGDLEEAHARAAHYDNKAEFCYSFLQILTACTASFVHGANDVSNAIAPYSVIYDIWQTGEIAGSKSPVPLWILAFGGIGIVLGLWTYGYQIMSNLGNKLTLQSPSRGFSMELGSAATIVLATRLKLPVSTTQCITGAVVGVGLCNGDWRALNWRMIAWIYMGWILTLPIAGIVSGCLMGIIMNAPRWGMSA
ncbi:phosphate-repressible phosphate permease [Microdochium trichocladiopsis]|uniref:Phosphate transporter n=1 Tax=Microdochium trichocladiopsis TaxID=1682393 RepID=A0A9P8YDK0_9PEZI|nr:phosphate-repressible phosphate permease [Microdochium trichocladiopsis]KAH7039842.1 phosphate-repressible phosphate permease [Microdochium trichocladiopsis]